MKGFYSNFNKQSFAHENVFWLKIFLKLMMLKLEIGIYMIALFFVPQKLKLITGVFIACQRGLYITYSAAVGPVNIQYIRSSIPPYKIIRVVIFLK